MEVIVIRPKDVVVSHEGQELVVRVPFPRILGYILPVPMIAFAIAIYSMYTASQDGINILSPPVIAAFLVMIAVDLYLAAVFLLNFRTVRVGGGRLKLQVGPVPWFGSKEIDTTRIKQLYCNDQLVSTSNGAVRNFQLNAILHDDSKAVFIQGMSRDHLLYIEDLVEKHLGIAATKVAGELR